MTAIEHRAARPLAVLLATGLLAAAMSGPAGAAGTAQAAARSGETGATTPGQAMQSWQAAYDRARQAYAAGDFGAAEPAARQALEIARQGQGETRSFVASSLSLLALVRQQQGQPGEAAGLLRQALDASAAAPGAEANTAALALNLGQALEASGQPEASLAAYQRSADAAGGQQLPPPDQAQATSVRALALQALARLHAERGDAARAQHYNQQLLASAPSLPRAQQVQALRRQAQLQKDQGQPDAAIASLRQALALYGGGDGSAPDASPGDAEDRLAVLSELAAFYGSLGRHDEAAPLHRQAVAMLEQTDPNGKALAAHLNELGLWHLQRKAYGPAQALLERARSIVEALDPQSLETARITANQAQLHEAQDGDAQAQALYRQALAIYASHGDSREALLGQAQALNYLAGQDYRRRRFAQAEPQFLRALALTEQADGPLSPRLLPLLDNLVALYRSQQREGQAAPYAERADSVRRALPAS